MALVKGRVQGKVFSCWTPLQSMMLDLGDGNGPTEFMVLGAVPFEQVSEGAGFTDSLKLAALRGLYLVKQLRTAAAAGTGVQVSTSVDVTIMRLAVLREVGAMFLGGMDPVNTDE
eukprot:15481105-Alexandrium_andersonii.AAC.1